MRHIKLFNLLLFMEIIEFCEEHIIKILEYNLFSGKNCNIYEDC